MFGFIHEQRLTKSLYEYLFIKIRKFNIAQMLLNVSQIYEQH